MGIPDPFSVVLVWIESKYKITQFRLENKLAQFSFV